MSPKPGDDRVSTHVLRTLHPVNDGELARRVYSRSWPVTALGDFTADEVIARLGARDLVWWQHKLHASPVRITDSTGAGFALAAPAISADDGGEGWELSYLFVEPAAFGTGLADALHDAVLAELGSLTDRVTGWVLAHNTRSQRFLTRHGWRDTGLRAPPWEDAHAYRRFELAL